MKKNNKVKTSSKSAKKVAEGGTPEVKKGEGADMLRNTKYKKGSKKKS